MAVWNANVGEAVRVGSGTRCCWLGAGIRGSTAFGNRASVLDALRALVGLRGGPAIKGVGSASDRPPAKAPATLGRRQRHEEEEDTVSLSGCAGGSHGRDTVTTGSRSIEKSCGSSSPLGFRRQRPCISAGLLLVAGRLDGNHPNEAEQHRGDGIHHANPKVRPDYQRRQRDPHRGKDKVMPYNSSTAPPGPTGQGRGPSGNGRDPRSAVPSIHGPGQPLR